MDWQRLLSNQIVPVNGNQVDFNKEFNYLVSLSSVRRLQDKAQVFPLEQGDFVRTRLTHSLEAMSIADEIGIKITDYLIKDDFNNRIKIKPKHAISDYENHFKFRETIQHIPSILKSAALIHDIGNPPFGHIGESIISDWFKQNINKFYIKKTITSVIKTDKPKSDYRHVTEYLNEEEVNDLLNFEGNAQLLRILSTLNCSKIKSGYSAALYSCCMKYTRNSTKKDFSKYIENHKLGYFETESKLVEEVKGIVGTGNNRNPLAFLLEAADDISYLSADIEDAIKKGIIDINDLVNKLCYLKDSKAVKKSKFTTFYIKLAAELTDLNKKTANKEDLILVVRNYLRETLIEESCFTFELNLNSIMLGTFKNDLLSSSKAVFIVKKLSQFLNNYVYRSNDIARQKAKVYKILNSLLDEIVPAAFSCLKTNSQKTDSKQDIVCELISSNYRSSCTKKIYLIKQDPSLSKERSIGLQIYECFRLAIDQISGMTDLYASSLFDVLEAKNEF